MREDIKTNFSLILRVGLKKKQSVERPGKLISPDNAVSFIS